MMDHLDEELMQALLDGELEGEAASAARAHLDACDACRESYEELCAGSQLFASAGALLDRPSPRQVIAFPPSSRTIRRHRRFALAIPRAAVLLFGFAVAASATIPGSPVRGWIETRLGSNDDPLSVERREGIETPFSAEPSATEMGVGIAPIDGRLRIVVTGAAPGLTIRALLTDARTGGAFSSGEATSTRFRGGGGLVEVFDAAGEELRVEIPRAAIVASLEVDGRTYVMKDGDQLRLITSGSDRLASEVAFQIEP